MKITLDIPDKTVLCAFLNGVRVGDTGMEMFSFQITGEEFKDGNTVKLPSEVLEDGR